MLCLVSWLLLQVAAPSGGHTCQEEYHRAGKFLANPDESVLIAGVIGWCRRQKTRLLWDENYAAVARRWSEALVEDGLPPDRPLPTERLLFELQRQGISDAAVVPFSVIGPAETLPPQLLEFLDDKVGGKRYTHFGVGVARFGNQQQMMSTLLVGRRPALISPIPVCPAVGDRIEFALQLLTGYSHPSWLMTIPGGGVQKDVLTQDAGVWHGSAALEAGPGKYSFEVLVQGPDGPEVAALLPLYAGVERPSAPTTVLRPAPPAYQNPAEAEAALLKLANQERLRMGLSALSADEKIAAVARSHALAVLAERHAKHRDPNSGQLPDRLRRAGVAFSRALENVALASTLQEAHQQLMESPAHRQNLLDADVSLAGMGVAMEKSARQDLVAVCQILVEAPLAAPDARTAAAILESINKYRLGRGRFRLGSDEELSREAQRLARRLASLGEEADPARETEELHQRLQQADPPLYNFTVRAWRTADPARLLQQPEILDEQVNRAGIGVCCGGAPARPVWLVTILAGR